MRRGNVRLRIGGVTCRYRGLAAALIVALVGHADLDGHGSCPDSSPQAASRLTTKNQATPTLTSPDSLPAMAEVQARLQSLSEDYQKLQQGTTPRRARAATLTG